MSPTNESSSKFSNFLIERKNAANTKGTLGSIYHTLGRGGEGVPQELTEIFGGQKFREEYSKYKS